MRAFVLAASLCAAFASRAQGPDWWRLDPQSTLVVDTSRGRIVVEMRPDWAPMAVARIVQLSRERVYDGLLFHRVIDGFVDQTGNPNNHDGGVSAHPNLKPEFHFDLDPAKIDVIATRSSDGISGFVGATPFVAQRSLKNPKHYTAWGAYCAGVVGMGRQADIGSANSEIFFMRDASRRLDHDYTVWGRVVQGQDVVRAIAVGEPPAHPDRMVKVRLMADLPPAEQPKFEVMDTQSAAFRALVDAARRKWGADFSICDVKVPLRTTL